MPWRQASQVLASVEFGRSDLMTLLRGAILHGKFEAFLHQLETTRALMTAYPEVLNRVAQAAANNVGWLRDPTRKVSQSCLAMRPSRRLPDNWNGHRVDG